MAEPFKELINPKTVRALADELGAMDPSFELERFVADATDGLAALELKARVRQVARVLRTHLPDDWGEALDLMVGAMVTPQQDDREVTGGARYWPMLQVVEDHGLCDPAATLAAIRHMTQRFSAEFAIRPLIDADPDGVLNELRSWVNHHSLHVRRLVSEGTRPRLPWGMRLNVFIKQPHCALPLLERLKDDPQEYVRRSVANHLNDIAKDHPQLVVDVAKRWWADGDENRRKLVRHALRTLIKGGDLGALAVLGFEEPSINVTQLRLDEKTVLYGKSVDFSIELTSTSSKDQQLMVDYAIHFPRKQNKTARKVFKGSKRNLPAGKSWPFSKRHLLAKVTTRKHYPGPHHIEILVNGRCYGEADFELVGGDELIEK